MNEADSKTYEIWQDFDKIYPGGAGELDSVMDKLRADSFFGMLSDSLSAAIEGAVSVFCALFGICIITVALGYLSFDEKKMRLIESSSLTVFSLLVFSFISPIITLMESSLSSLLDFTSSLAPILSSILLSLGCVNGAGTQALGMNVVTSLISLLSKSILLPLSFSVFAFAAASSVSEKGAPRIIKSIKTVFFSVFGILTTVLFSSLGLQNLVSSAADGLYIKTAKQAISGIVPVVGSTISASLSSFFGALSLLRGSVFGMSIVFILSLFLPCFFSLLLIRVAFSLAESFMEFCESSGGVRLFSSFLLGIDTLLALYVLSFLSSFFGLFFFLKGGGAALA